MARCGSDIPSCSRQTGQPSSRNEAKVLVLYTQLWMACAGSLVQVPQAGDKVFYFPQGHIEQVEACMSRDSNFEMPMYNLPSKILCKVVNTQLKVVPDTDEVFAQISLLPESDESGLGDDSASTSKPRKVFSRSFSEELTPSDTSAHGGFSVPKRHADECFPPLDMDQDPPTQELLVKDLSGREWVFRHIYRGIDYFLQLSKLEARGVVRGLLTSMLMKDFLTCKCRSAEAELDYHWLESICDREEAFVAGDKVFFFRGGGGKLLVGFRRASKPRITAPTSFMSSLSLHHGILATALHALSARTMFTVYYRPWSRPGEFIIPYDQYVRSAGIGYTPGMRFRMQFENENNPDYRCITLSGRIIDVGDVDHLRWPDSDWRRLKVQWDGILNAPDLPERVCPWSIELFFRSKTTQLLPVMPSLKRSFPFDPSTPNMPFQIKDTLIQRCPGVLQGQEIRAVENPPNRVPTNFCAPKFASCLKNNDVRKQLAILDVNFVLEDRNPPAQTSETPKCMLFGVNILNGLPSPQGMASPSSVAKPNKRPKHQFPHSCLITDRSCTKVMKHGTALGRSTDPSCFHSYEELVLELDLMFEFKGKLSDGISGWHVAYLDGEGNVMLLGDCPWPDFRAMVRKIFIRPAAEDAEKAD